MWLLCNSVKVLLLVRTSSCACSRMPFPKLPNGRTYEIKLSCLLHSIWFSKTKSKIKKHSIEKKITRKGLESQWYWLRWSPGQRWIFSGNAFGLLSCQMLSCSLIKPSKRNKAKALVFPGAMPLLPPNTPIKDSLYSSPSRADVNILWSRRIKKQSRPP